MSYPKCYTLLAERLAITLEAAGYTTDAQRPLIVSLLADEFAMQQTLDLMQEVVATEPDSENE